MICRRSRHAGTPAGVGLLGAALLGLFLAAGPHPAQGRSDSGTASIVNGDHGNRDACTRRGNGTVTPPEGCDDGNLIDGDGGNADGAPAVCGNAVVEGDEQCDDGAVCVGGANEGEACIDPAACDSGNCAAVGGDGCAANCTWETTRVLALDAGRASLALANAAVQLRFSLSGRLTLRTGQPRPSEPSGELPVTIGRGDFRLGPIPIPGLGCLCLAGWPGPLPVGTGTIGCGTSGLYGVEVARHIDHDIGDVDPSCATGTLEMRGQCVDAVCASGSHAGAPCRIDRDCGGPHEGVCNGPETVATSGSGSSGSALIDLHLVSRHFRSCAADGDPNKGADGLPCTDDDSFPGSASTGYATFLPLDIRARFTTGTAGAEIDDANAAAGRTIALAATGSVFDCSRFVAAPAAALGPVALAAAVPALDEQSFGDTVTTVLLSGSLKPVLCLGDCNGDGEVMIEELVGMIDIALGGADVSACYNGDADGSGAVTIDEIIQAVNRALDGCSSAGGACGGVAGLPCAARQVCDLRDQTCSVSDLAGTCVARPDACREVLDRVCGCDGVTYSSDCERLTTGATLAHAGACS